MRQRQRGFTLIELLIAVFLLALLTGMLFDGLRVATHHFSRETEQLDRSSEVALVQDFLRAQLADAQPLLINSGSTSTIDFDGGPDTMAFIAPAPAGVALGGLQVLSIHVVEGRGATGGRLVADWRPYRDTPAVEPASPSRPLLDHLREAALAYFGSTVPKEPPAWHDSWQAKTDLPMLVRLSAVFTDGRVMPELIVALRLSSAAQVSDRQ